MQVTTALLLAVLEVVPPIVLTDEFRLPPAATSILFGVASLAVFALFALVEARYEFRGSMDKWTSIKSCLEALGPSGLKSALQVLSRKVSGRKLMRRPED